MSNYEWLYGEVALPAPTVASIKRDYRNRHNAIVVEAYEHLKKFRNDNLTSSEAKWRAAIGAIDTPGKATPALRISISVAKSLSTPRAVKWDDFSLLGWGRASVGANSFPLFNNEGLPVGQVTFTGRIFSWEVFEGNHAVDDFMDSPDYGRLQKLFEDFEWTRGSGGGVTYWSERSGEREVKETFGPKGLHYKVTERERA